MNDKKVSQSIKRTGIHGINNKLLIETKIHRNLAIGHSTGLSPYTIDNHTITEPNTIQIEH